MDGKQHSVRVDPLAKPNSESGLDVPSFVRREGAPAKRVPNHGRDFELPSHLSPKKSNKGRWAVLIGLLLLAAIVLLSSGCAPRSPLAEPGPVITRTITTTTGNSVETITEKSRAAAELEYRLAVINGEVEKAKAIAARYYDSYGRMPTSSTSCGGCYQTYGGRRVVHR